MGAEEIAEIADVIHTVLSQTEAATPAPGEDERKARKGRYEVPTSVIEAARARTRDLLDRYPVYPEIDLGVISSTDFGRQALPEQGSTAPSVVGT
jgi:glycine hydroxymethyltransferase